MSNNLIKKRNKLLQKLADFICFMLEISMEIDEYFSFWLWQGLYLNYWCVENEIYLD